MARRVPGGFRSVCGLAALALRPGPGGDDPAAGAGLREPVRQRPGPSHHPVDRPAAGRGRGLGRGVRGLRAHGHGAGGQRAAGPARPVRRGHPAGAVARGAVRGEHRRALGAAPRPAAVRHRHRPAGLADPGRRDQHLAADPAAPVPAQGWTPGSSQVTASGSGRTGVGQVVAGST
ncbi:hypothetical protein SGPA1_20138 [Streptomyces misionensis JCM 4497]